MIKIEVLRETRKLVNNNHLEYIKLTSVPKLELMIKSTRKQKRTLLEKLFGAKPNAREACIIDFCLSADLKGKLKKFDSVFREVYGFEFSDASINKNKKAIQDTRDGLDSIFNYLGFNFGKILSNGKKWSRHEFINSLGIKVCPYCNRQYITSYEDDTGYNKTTADADHYYPKAEYPILQMNIYNLVPSCSVCNSRTKGTSDKRHLYPYEDPSNSLTFKIPLEAGDQVSEILIDSKENVNAIASNDVFKLSKIYQAHRDEAAELKQNAAVYFEYGDNVYKVLQGLSVPFDIFSTWFSFMGKDALSEPLIKLRQDIFNQMKVELKK